jgi:hypothetical protein
MELIPNLSDGWFLYIYMKQLVSALETWGGVSNVSILEAEVVIREWCLSHLAPGVLVPNIIGENYAISPSLLLI